MTKAEQYEKIIFDLKEWFEKRVEHLQIIIDKENESKIIIEGENGEQIELPEELKKGFHFGIQTAIEVLGEFPVKITKNQ